MEEALFGSTYEAVIRFKVYQIGSVLSSVRLEPRPPPRPERDAKARRLPDAVSAVAEQITGVYPEAVKQLDANGSDIVAQLRLAAESASQVGDGQLSVLILTDGLQNSGVAVRQIVQSPESAAETFTVPNLSGSLVTFSGIGQVSGQAPPTEVVDAVKTFYGNLCSRTGADLCDVVTETAGAGS